MSLLTEFCDANPDWSRGMSDNAAQAFLRVCSGCSHLRNRKALAFYSDALSWFRLLSRHACGEALVDGVVFLAERNWALVEPCVFAVPALPEDESWLKQWVALAGRLSCLDVDVGMTFLRYTPVVAEKLGMDVILEWGEHAFAALTDFPGMWQAVSAYLIQSASLHCGFTLNRWAFFLRQAGRIAAVSANAALNFVQMGNRACLLLTDEETEQWVGCGLSSCRTDQELDNFFSAGSLKAQEARDGLASGVPLQERRQTLSLICEALLGRPVAIRPNTVLYGHPGFTGKAATDGISLFMPEVVPSFGLMKLMALHQAMLLDRGRFLEESGRIFFDPIWIHMYADKRLAARFPGIVSEMRRRSDQDLPEGYPFRTGRHPSSPLPWWGDILPDLITRTQTVVSEIKEKISEQAEDLPPELVEMLVSRILSQGETEPDALGRMLSLLMSQLEFLSPDAEELPDTVRTFLYKEWDANLSDYKLDWCLVRQKIAGEDPNSFVRDILSRRRGLVNLIRRQFARLKPDQFRRYYAQPAGDDLDINALVESLTDRRSGSHLSENVYIRRDKRVRDVAVLFLVDLSESTGEKVGDQRIVDIQKEAMVLMAEALNAIGDPYAVFGFCSDGRFRVDLIQVKDFSEPFDERIYYRLGNLEPSGLTRMGAVVRHAIYKLEQVAAAIRILVILTDGRPYDLEYGSLDYAIADTHQSIQEARRKRIHPFIITSDAKSTDYLRRIAPQTQSIIVPRVEMLPGLLPAVYKRLTV